MIKIVFFATPKIAVSSLDFLSNQKDIDCCAVLTKMDKPQGRGQKVCPNPIKTLAEQKNIPVLQSKLLRKDTETIEKLKSLKPDFFITFAYGQILSKEILDIPKFGTINLHASLLPKYRGANPIQCAIVNGETKTGITTMLTVEELDAGDICLAKEIDIPQDMNDIELCEKISTCSPELLYKTILNIYNGKLQPHKQSSTPTFTCKFEKQDGLIDWSKDALSIHNKIRGLCSWPCCYTFFNKKMIKIIKSCVSDKKTSLPCGSFVGKNNEGIEIAAGNNEVITIINVKPEGKKEMSAKDWLNGSQMKSGDKFLCE